MYSSDCKRATYESRLYHWLLLWTRQRGREYPFRGWPGAYYKGDKVTDPKRILIVDDDPGIRRLLAVTLSHYTLVLVSTGAAADRVTELVFQPDLIILDWNLGPLSRITGHQACVLLHARFPDVPILIFSGDTGLHNRELAEMLEKCASDFITKPYKPSRLLLKIATLLNEEIG